MERAIRGNPVRALAELILNADDSYRRLEDGGATVSGRIDIEIERRHSNSTVSVRDFAEGMTRTVAVSKMTDWGGAQSGQDRGGSARGFYGRGAKDALMMMEQGRLRTIKDTKITSLKFIPNGRGGEPDVEDNESAATAIERKGLGIPKGNGTVVSFDIPSGTPQFRRLKDSLTNYYMLRRLNSDPNRIVLLRNVNTGEETQLTYKPPVGEEVCGVIRPFKIGTLDLEIDAKVFLAPDDIDQVPSDRREGGLLIMDEYDSALDLSLFRFDPDPDAAKIFGDVEIRGLRAALLSDENIVTEERDGLNRTNEIAQIIIKEIESILEPIVKLEREKGAKANRKLSAATQKRVNNMVDELNKLAAEYTGTGTTPGPAHKQSTGGDTTATGATKPHPDLFEFIPKSVTLTPGVPSTVSLYVNTGKCTGEAIVDSESEDLDLTPESFTIDSSDEIFHQTIGLRCDVPGASGTVVIVTDAGEAELPFKVEAVPYPVPADGLEFIPGARDITAGRVRTLDLYVDLSKVGPHSNVVLELEDTTVAELSVTSLRVDPTKARGDVVHLPVKLIGLQVGAKTRVIASVNALRSVCQVEVRSRKAKERNTGGLFSGIAFEDKAFPKCWFRPDDEKMVINTREPSFEYIGVSEASFETDRGVQVAVAEVCTQAACARISERTVPGGGKRPWYLSNDPVKRIQEDRVFTEQLTRIVGPVLYRNLVHAAARASMGNGSTAKSIEKESAAGESGKGSN